MLGCCPFDNWTRRDYHEEPRRNTITTGTFLLSCQPCMGGNILREISILKVHLWSINLHLGRCAEVEGHWSLKPWATATPCKFYVINLENKLWWQPCLIPHKTYDSFNSMSITGVLLLRTWFLFSSWSRSLEVTALSNSCCRLSLHLPFIIMHYNVCTSFPRIQWHSLPFLFCGRTREVYCRNASSGPRVVQCCLQMSQNNPGCLTNSRPWGQDKGVCHFKARKMKYPFPVPNPNPNCSTKS